MKSITMVVSNLEATVRNRGGSVNPGDYILNKKEGQPLIWIARNELQNALARQEMSTSLPCSELKGAKLTLNHFEITEKELDEAIARGDQALNSRGEMTKGFVIAINGRKVPFTRPGTKYVLTNIDLTNCEFSENTVNKIKVIAASVDLQASRTKARTAQTGLAAATAPIRPATTETVIEEPVSDSPVVEMPDLLKGIKTDAAGNTVNEDGSVLSPEQNEALALWVQSHPSVKEEAAV
jgi:hypothetical protein